MLKPQNFIVKHYIIILCTGWLTKMSLFFFGNKFYKNKETFKIFSPQLLEVYRILLVETTLESIMFYYTFSVINTMFVPCTALLYDSTAATGALKLSKLYWAFLVESVYFSSDDLLLSVNSFNKLCLSGTTSENRQVEILGIGWPGVIGLMWNEFCPMGSYAWGIPVFCSRNEAPPHLSYFFTENRYSWISHASLARCLWRSCKISSSTVVNLCSFCMPCYDSVLNNNYLCNLLNFSLLL